MSALASTYKVPDWAVKNKEIFLSAARGVVPPARKERSQLHMSLSDLQAIPRDEQVTKAAISMSVLSEETSNGIKPPTEPAGADYFRDVANHPDVLSTIIFTARTTVGFKPDVNGRELTDEQVKEYIQKFNEFLHELDLYYAYIDLRKASSKTLPNDTNDCNLMLSTITGVLAEALGVATSGSVFDTLVEAASSLIKTAVDYVVSESGKATSANFEMVGLPKSNEVGEEASRDPISAVTFTTTTLSPQVSGKTTSQDSSITIFASSYKLKSSAIIAYADQLAGTSITGNTALRDYINSVLPFQPLLATSMS